MSDLNHVLYRKDGKTVMSELMAKAWPLSNRPFPNHILVLPNKGYDSVFFQDIDFGKDTIVETTNASLHCIHIKAKKIICQNTKPPYGNISCNVYKSDVQEVKTRKAGTCVQDSTVQSIDLINPIHFLLTGNKDLEALTLLHIQRTEYGYLSGSPRAEKRNGITTNHVEMIPTLTYRKNMLFVDNGHYLYEKNSNKEKKFLQIQKNEVDELYTSLIELQKNPEPSHPYNYRENEHGELANFLLKEYQCTPTEWREKVIATRWEWYGKAKDNYDELCGIIQSVEGNYAFYKQIGLST